MDWESNIPDWPKEPYKGLAYYKAEDRRLFAGRDQDISTCMQRMTNQSTAIFLLYGRTGSGKSSFLRAGLIPNMEEQQFSCTFLSAKDPETDLHTPVFVRSTSDPLGNISAAVFEYLQDVRVAGSSRQIDANEALLGAQSRIEFVRKCQKPQALTKSLKILARLLPTTLVIILDQAEEVLTLSQADGKEKRNFFDFLKYFLAAQINVKFLIALRSEHLGEFRDYSRLDQRSAVGVSQYQLKDLTQPQVEEAILRPTRRNTEDTPPYDFDFDDEVIKELKRDLFQSRRTGGVLPVMQIVCRDLYHELDHVSTSRVIDSMMLNTGKGVAGRLDAHISKSLRKAMKGAGYPSRSLRDQEENWRTALVQLADFEQDGTARTSMVPAATIARYLENAKVPESKSEDILTYLTLPGVLILRRFSFLNPLSGQNETMYALGHDAIGLGLSDWANRQIDAKRARIFQRTRRWAVAAAVGSAVAAFSVFVVSYSMRVNTEITSLVSASLRTKDQNLIVSTAAILEAYKTRNSVFAPLKILSSSAQLDGQLKHMSNSMPEVSVVKTENLSVKILDYDTYLSKAETRDEGSDWQLNHLWRPNVPITLGGTSDLEFRFYETFPKTDSARRSFLVTGSEGGLIRNSSQLVEFDETGMTSIKNLAPERLSIGGFTTEPGGIILHNRLAFFYNGKMYKPGERETSNANATLFFKLGSIDSETASRSDLLTWVGSIDGQTDKTFRIRRRNIKQTTEEDINGQEETAGPFGGYILRLRSDDFLVELFGIEELKGRILSPLSTERANTKDEALRLEDLASARKSVIYEIIERNGDIFPGERVIPAWSSAEDLAVQAWIDRCWKPGVDCRMITPVDATSDPILLFERVYTSETTDESVPLVPDRMLVNVQTGVSYNLAEGPSLDPFQCGKKLANTGAKSDFAFSATALGGNLRIAVYCAESTLTDIWDITDEQLAIPVESVLRWSDRGVSDSHFSPNGQYFTSIASDSVITSWDLEPERSLIDQKAQVAEICRRFAPLVPSIEQSDFEELWEKDIDTPAPQLKEICNE